MNQSLNYWLLLQLFFDLAGKSSLSYSKECAQSRGQNYFVHLESPWCVFPSGTKQYLSDVKDPNVALFLRCTLNIVIVSHHSTCKMEMELCLTVLQLEQKATPNYQFWKVFSMFFKSLTVRSKTALHSDCKTHLEMGRSVQPCTFSLNFCLQQFFWI